MRADISDCFNSNHPLLKDRNDFVLGCHCIETNLKCRDILLFLKSSGRFRAQAVGKALHQELRLAIEDTFANDFDEMIEMVMYPAFLRRFRKRYGNLQKGLDNMNLAFSSIKTFQNCLDDGPDCIVAMNTINSLLHKTFRIFNVLNQDIRPQNKSLTLARRRNRGTLIANLNFLLDNDSAKSEIPTVAMSELQSNLAELGEMIAPSGAITLPQTLQLLGYTQNLGIETNPKRFKDFDLSFSKTSEGHCDMEQLQRSWQFYMNAVSDYYEGISKAYNF